MSELDDLAKLERGVEALLPRLHERAALLAALQIGWRSPALVHALEELAASERLARGTWRSLFFDADATRALVLLVRAQLGVGPSSAPRVRALAAELDDPVAQALVLAHVELHVDPDGIADRLARLVQGRAGEEPTLLGLVLETTLATVRAHVRSPSVRRRAWSAIRLGAGAYAPSDRALCAALLPDFAQPLGPGRGVPEALAIDARERGTRVARPSAAQPATSAPARALVRPGESVYRAFRAGAAQADRAMLQGLLGWPVDAQLSALDGLADATEVSPAALDVLSELAIERAGALAAAATSSTDEHRLLDGTLHALCAHAPWRWQAHVESLAGSIARTDRAGAARALALAWTGPEGESSLVALELDPARSVRAAARRARAARAARHDGALATRRIARAALLDLARPETAHPSTVDPHESPSRLRRLVRVLDDAPLGPWGRSMLEDVMRGVGPVAVVPRARVTLVSGHGALALAVPVHPEALTLSVPSTTELESFVQSAPSRYMRLQVTGRPDRAVTVSVERGTVILREADPAMLTHLP